MLCTLYKNNNSICGVKVYFIKTILKDSDFIGLNLIIVPDEEKEVYVIILHLYKLNTQIWREKQLSPHHKVDPIVLWFVNIVNCECQVIFICFMQASAFIMLCPFNYCDNCIYKGDQNGNVPVYNLYNIITC